MIFESSACQCGKANQTIDHLIFECELLEKKRDKLISVVSKTDNWPLSKRRLIQEHFQPFVKFIHDIPLESMSEV
jgi:hypothetical protein